MLIYKILTSDQWDDLQRLGESTGAPVDIADGFVHFSTAEQVRETAAKHFAGQDGLRLLALEAETLGDAVHQDRLTASHPFPEREQRPDEDEGTE